MIIIDHHDHDHHHHHHPHPEATFYSEDILEHHLDGQ
jgi:hypothetical protein